MINSENMKKDAALSTAGREIDDFGKAKHGTVYLTGAGPGDPELLTLKAKRVIREADVIVYDSLISEEILSYAKKECEIIYAGKRSSNHAMPQYSINELLAQKAKENRVVVRLKGGDPYLFGRGGEEAERLHKDNIPFEIVPGISSSFAVPSYAGIPLTHRDYASTVAIVTGHEGEHKNKSTINWEKLSGADTIVVLMGYKNLDSITAKIIAAGKNQDTPCAVIQEGTTFNQKAVTGTLSTINSIVEKEGLSSPMIFIVGNVVKLRDVLNWFERRPLKGLTVLVTRPEGHNGTLASKLGRLGAFVVSLPLIKSLKESPKIDEARIDEVVAGIDGFEYIIFTSVNAVDGFLGRVFGKGFDTRILSGKKVVSVGKATSSELKKFGIVPDIVPETFSQSGIIDAFKQNKIEIKGKKILFPQALKINPELPDFLAEGGAITENLPVYETIVPEESKDKLKSLFSSIINVGKSVGNKEVSVHKNIGLPENLDSGSFVITFTSYSTVENFVIMAEDLKKGLVKDIINAGVKFASIGKNTADYALGLGIKSDIIAEKVTVDSLISGISTFYKNNGTGGNS